MNKARRGFASDNNAGIHSRVFEAIQRANEGHCIAYGDDPWTGKALTLMRDTFGEDSRSYFVFTGTAANVLCLAALCRPYSAVICPESAHINVDECGAPEHALGIKLLTVDAPRGKLTPGMIEPFLSVAGNEHHAQPAVISITQATELGTVYRQEEIRDLADRAHENGLYLHMDGARLSNAAVFLEKDLRDITADAGVDALSFGGTKNGMMCGEAVVFFRPELAGNFRYLRKQNTHLASKMRFLAAQFLAFLTDDLWRANAGHANIMAGRLADGLSRIDGVTITQPVEANGVFFTAPPLIMSALREEYFYYVVDESVPVGRLMTSYDTTEDDVNRLVQTVALIAGRDR
jgi:threonine aldolase